MSTDLIPPREKCWVCGDEVLGWNYSALSCKSCKVFFYRYSATKFECRKGNSCKIDTTTRSQCKKCRLNKCFSVGMSKMPVEAEEIALPKDVRIYECNVMTFSEHKKCLVCGDKASAFNYNGLSCESCKLFFRRNALRIENLKCTKENICEIVVATRKGCPKCRMEKCLTIGMRKELVCLRLNTKKVNNNIDSNRKEVILREERIFYQKELNAHECEMLFEVQRAMTFFGDESTLPRAEPVSTYREAFNLEGLYIKKVIKFCKNIAVFKQLDEKAQLSILKQFHSEIMAIRNAFMYDVQQDGFYNFANESEDKVTFVSMDCYRDGFKGLDLTRYCRNWLTSLHLTMENDTNLRDLILGQLLFKPREITSCPQFVSNQYKVYCRLIRRYLENKFTHPFDADHKYSSLMFQLNDLSFIRETKHQIYQEMQREFIYPVLVEIYHLDQ